MSVLNAFLGRLIVQIINPILLLLSALAVIVFIWGVFQLILGATDEKKREEGKKSLLWGIVGLVIIFGAYGILNITMATFNLTPNGQTKVQCVANPNAPGC